MRYLQIFMLWFALALQPIAQVKQLGPVKQSGPSKTTFTAGGGTSNCGETTNPTGSDGTNALFEFGTPCVTGANTNGYSVGTIFYYVGVGGLTSATFDLGVYTNSAGAPNTRLCHASTTTAPTVLGWQSLAVSGCGTLTASTTYWVAYITDNNAGAFQGTVAGNCPGTATSSVFSNSAQGSAVLANPFGASTSLGDCYTFYMVLTAL